MGLAGLRTLKVKLQEVGEFAELSVKVTANAAGPVRLRRTGPALQAVLAADATRCL